MNCQGMNYYLTENRSKSIFRVFDQYLMLLEQKD